MAPSEESRDVVSSSASADEPVKVYPVVEPDPIEDLAPPTAATPLPTDAYAEANSPASFLVDPSPVPALDYVVPVVETFAIPDVDENAKELERTIDSARKRDEDLRQFLASQPTRSILKAGLYWFVRENGDVAPGQASLCPESADDEPIWRVTLPGPSIQQPETEVEFNEDGTARDGQPWRCVVFVESEFMLVRHSPVTSAIAEQIKFDAPESTIPSAMIGDNPHAITRAGWYWFERKGDDAYWYEGYAEPSGQAWRITIPDVPQPDGTIATVVGVYRDGASSLSEEWRCSSPFVSTMGKAPSEEAPLTETEEGPKFRKRKPSRDFDPELARFEIPKEFKRVVIERSGDFMEAVNEIGFRIDNWKPKQRRKAMQYVENAVDEVLYTLDWLGALTRDRHYALSWEIHSAIQHAVDGTLADDNVYTVLFHHDGTNRVAFSRGYLSAEDANEAAEIFNAADCHPFTAYPLDLPEKERTREASDKETRRRVDEQIAAEDRLKRQSALVFATSDEPLDGYAIVSDGKTQVGDLCFVKLDEKRSAWVLNSRDGDVDVTEFDRVIRKVETVVEVEGGAST